MRHIIRWFGIAWAVPEARQYGFRTGTGARGLVLRGYSLSDPRPTDWLAGILLLGVGLAVLFYLTH